jgi:hypothetical protein
LDNVIKASALILTLIYVLSNLNDLKGKIRLTSRVDPPDFMTKYIETLSNKITVMGDNFLEIVENLYLASSF